MLKEYFEQYQRYFYASIGMHGLLLTLLVLSVDPIQSSRAASSPLQASSQEIVQAVMVDESKVTVEVDRLKAEEKKEKEVAKKLQAVKEQEIAKLERIKQDIVKAKAEEEAKLAEIKIVKEKEKQELDALKEIKEKKKKDMVALNEEQAVEQNRIKTLHAEREKEEKKRLEAKQKLEEKRQAEEAKRLAGLKATKDAAHARATKEAKNISMARSILDGWSKKVEMNKRRVLGIPDGITCTLLIHVLPDGSIRVQVSKSSGNPIHDDLSVKAAYQSEPFPLPEDPEVKDKLREVEIKITSKEGANNV
jgi:colicin import membrane protein